MADANAATAAGPKPPLAGTAAVVLLVLAADWSSKAAVVRLMELGDSIRVLPFLNLVHAQNTGMAFSLLAHGGAGTRWFLVGVSILLSTILLYLIVRRLGTRTELFAFQLVLAGALGNLQGRAMDGYVVDFIDVHAGGHHWPAFNVADSAISLGFLVFLCTPLFSRRDRIG